MARTRTEMKKSDRKNSRENPGAQRLLLWDPVTGLAYTYWEWPRRKMQCSLALTECTVRGFGYPSLLPVPISTSNTLGLQASHHSSSAFACVLGNWTLVLKCVWQVLHPQSRLPSPLFLILLLNFVFCFCFVWFVVLFETGSLHFVLASLELAYHID